MNIRRILCLSVVFLIPQLVSAKLQLPVEALGKMEGILDFCTQADSQSASKYQELKKAIVGDAEKKEVADARNTQEYKDSYQGISEELAKVPKEEAVKACSAYLEGGK